jgi:hypothetical protein
MIAGVPQTPLPARSEESERRPAAVLAVYSWDLLLAILALFGALAPFAGGIAVGTTSVGLPLAVQIVAALSSASYAATLLIVASLLTRRRRWVRQVQIVTLAAAIALAALSLAVGYATRSGIDVRGLLGTVVFMLLDALAVVIMTERRITAWYTEAAQTPRYVLATLGFWALSECAFVGLAAALR